MLLEKQSACHRCMFRKRGLLLVGLFTILIGITAVITSKLVWPVIVSTYERNEATAFDAVEVPVQTFNHTVNHTFVMTPEATDLKRVKVHDGFWLYYYWNSENHFPLEPLVPSDEATNATSKLRPLYNWILKEITGNVTLYMRYAELPTVDSFKHMITPVTYDPRNPLIVFGCPQWVFFGIHKSTNFTGGDFSVKFTQYEDKYTKQRADQCEHMDQKERIIRAFYPILASLFLLFGYLVLVLALTVRCMCMSYWGYQKVTNPESELYEIVGQHPIDLQNF